MSPRHQSDTKPGWIRRKFASIDKQIRELSAARRLESATIGKGGLTVKDRGKIHMPFPADLGTGDAIFIGPDTDGTYRWFTMRVNAGDGVTPVLAATYYPDQPDFPGGFAQIGLAGDLSSLEGKSGVYAWLPATSEGLVVSPGELDLTSSGVMILTAPSGVKIQHSTTGAAANCFIDPSDSRIWRSTSSRRYKQDIEDAEVDPAVVLQMTPRTWRDKGEVEANPDTEQRYIGFIAEELHELGGGLEQFVIYDKDGQPDALAEPRLVVPLLALVKDLHARVEALETKSTDNETGD